MQIIKHMRQYYLIYMVVTCRIGDSWILHVSAQYIINPLVSIINKSLERGYFPNDFKTAKVIPIFKNGDSNQTQNYRPISLLNNLSKLFEKIIYKRVSDFLAKNNILFDNQFGFRKGHSTIDEIFSSINMIRTEKDKKKRVRTFL